LYSWASHSLKMAMHTPIPTYFHKKKAAFFPRSSAVPWRSTRTRIVTDNTRRRRRNIISHTRTNVKNKRSSVKMFTTTVYIYIRTKRRYTISTVNVFIYFLVFNVQLVNLFRKIVKTLKKTFAFLREM